MLKIREFDGSDADYEIWVQIANAVDPRLPWAAADVKRHDSFRDEKFLKRRFIVEEDSVPVAAGEHGHISEYYHPQRFGVYVNVLPAHRNQGIGGMLYEYLMEDMAALNPLELITSTSEEHPQSMPFIEKRGFVLTLREIETRLNVSEFDPASFLEREARLNSEGISFKSYRDLINDPEHQQKLYDLEMLIEEDIPMSAEFTPTPMTSWLKQRTPDENPDFLLDAYIIALDSDKYIGVSTLWAQSADEHLYVGITGILREYRRRGIALTLKAKAIIAAQQMNGNRQIITWNEEDNPMLQLNYKLGFKPQPAYLEFKKVIGEISD